jgi:hypothetical protein
LRPCEQPIFLANSNWTDGILNQIVINWQLLRALDPMAIKLAVDKMRGYTLQGKSLDQNETMDVPYTAAEQIYQLLANALDGVGDEKKMMMLMKLCLVQSLDSTNVADFKRHLTTALKDMNSF